MIPQKNQCNYAKEKISIALPKNMPYDTIVRQRWWQRWWQRW